MCQLHAHDCPKLCPNFRLRQRKAKMCPELPRKSEPWAGRIPFPAFPLRLEPSAGYLEKNKYFEPAIDIIDSWSNSILLAHPWEYAGEENSFPSQRYQYPSWLLKNSHPQDY